MHSLLCYFLHPFPPNKKVGQPVFVLALVLLTRTGSATAASASSTTSTLTTLLALLVAGAEPVLVFPMVPSARLPPAVAPRLLETLTFTATPCTCLHLLRVLSISRCARG
ncbi:hypothetical protein BYT27DRAFT_6402643 [Phlegmacium glaucopus]|nr:hypothetical protein BYT27DRAFT_6402643 [Phlegmacium glaucopus]